MENRSKDFFSLRFAIQESFKHYLVDFIQFITMKLCGSLILVNRILQTEYIFTKVHAFQALILKKQIYSLFSVIMSIS
jgi:hypothetical protein